MSTAERDAFLDATLAAQIHAERALHQGDITPRLSTWSHAEPVTLFGAGDAYSSGWRDVRAVLDWMAASFTSCDDYEFELLAADAVLTTLTTTAAEVCGVGHARGASPPGTTPTSSPTAASH